MSSILLILIIFSASTLLFAKVSGTLNPGKLNIISYVYYIFMLQSFVGAALISLGFDKHYTLGYLLNYKSSISVTVTSIFLTAILFPLSILIFQKILKFNIKKEYSQFLKKDVAKTYSDVTWILFCIGSALCILLLIIFLIKIGYIPVWRLIHAPDEFNFATERVRISSISVVNSYVTNIMILMMIPLLSYVSFAYMLTTKKKRWMILFAVLFIAAGICKTYKFEKSPIVFHLLIYVLILIYLKGGIKFIYMLITGGAMGGILVASYFLSGFSGNLLDIYNGPLGRTLFTQVGTLSYCYDLFPNVFDFLNGRSFSPTVLQLIGMDPEAHLRSAKLTMAFYGSEKVYDGTAGVMNTLFIGEAYANWGYLGVIFSVLWVAFIITILLWVILKIKKTPSSISLLAILTIRIGTMLQGGFCDFIYSFDLIFTILLMFGIYLFFESDGKIQKRIEKLFQFGKGKILKCFKK